MQAERRAEGKTADLGLLRLLQRGNMRANTAPIVPYNGIMLLRPTYIIDGDVTDIDLDQLYADGIRAFILDLDSTLVAPRSGVLTESVNQWLAAARLRFKLAVVSNNLRNRYVERIAKSLNMPVMGGAVKPRRSAFRRACKLLGVPPHQVAVVGDRPLTDIWGGQRAGMKTVLVWPLKTMNEPRWIKLIRRMERVFIRP